MRFQRARYYALQKLVRANVERSPLDAACERVSAIASQAIGADYMVVGRRTGEGTTTYHGGHGVTSGTWARGMLGYAPLAIDYETAVESGKTVVVDLDAIDDTDEAFEQSKAEGAKRSSSYPSSRAAAAWGRCSPVARTDSAAGAHPRTPRNVRRPSLRRGDGRTA